MTALHFTIQTPEGKGVKFHCDTLAREDATDEEITLAHSIEDAILGFLAAVAKEAGATVEQSQSREGDGYTRIRSKRTKA